MSETHSAIRGKTLKQTLMGGVSAALLAFMTYLATGQSDHTERIRAVEVRQEETTKRLERIEEKIDRLIEQR